jgi:hypothetical protein
MEKIKLSDLKKAIEETRLKIKASINREKLDTLSTALRTCPPQFLRIAKMYEEVKRIKQEDEV